MSQGIDSNCSSNALVINSSEFQENVNVENVNLENVNLENVKT